MLRIAICDDSAEALQCTKALVSKWDGYSGDVRTELFDGGEALIEAHSSTPFDIILLDIVMPHINGLDTAIEIRKRDKTVKLVFLTSSQEFAVDSYSVKANDYILKPISKERLYKCLNELWSDIADNAKSIIARDGTSTHRIELRNIEFLEAQGKHVVFNLCHGLPKIATDPFYLYENKLLPEYGFFRCHRSYIVNIFRIDTYTSKEITVKSGHRIPISRNYHKVFESAYFELLFGKAGDI